MVVYYDGNSNDVCMCDGVMVWWCDGDSNGNSNDVCMCGVWWCDGVVV